MRIYKDMSLAEYIKHPNIANHDLTNLADCPAVFKYHKDNPVNNSTPDQLEGSALHGILEYGEIPLWLERDDGRKTIAEKSDNGIILLGWERYDRVTVMAANILEHPDIKKLLKKGTYEASVFTELDGVNVKSRPDFLPDDIPVVIDFKSTRYKLTRRNMANECVRWRYYVGAPYYLDQQPERQAYAYVFSCKLPPYLAALYEPDEPNLEHGRQDYRRQLELYKRCMETGEWPGYRGVRALSLPKCILQEGE